MAINLTSQAVELVLIALGLRTTDLLGQGIALGLGFLLARLGFANLLVQVDQARGLRLQRALCQAGIELGRFFTDQLDIMHGISPDGVEVSRGYNPARLAGKPISCRMRPHPLPPAWVP